jgi:DNA (cytosine-5)-methyltransferase 1
MSKPRLLDLFCGQGGAAAGYIAAGFAVVGVDLADHSKRYPAAFVRGNAMTLLEDARFVRQFDAIHTSPPCQGYSIATAGNPSARAKYDRLIAATRELLEQTGKPWVIENVEQARDEMRDPIVLCGSMFGLETFDEDETPLRLERHRLFESNFPIEQPGPEHHFHNPAIPVAGVYGGSRRAPLRSGVSLAEAAPFDRFAARHVRHGGYVPRSKAVQQRLLGIDWMTVRGMQESIPPVYAQYVGLQLLAHLEQVAA